MLIEETSVADEALPVAIFKAHLRVSSGFSTDDVQDAVVGSFLRAALAAVEARTQKALIARDFSWSGTLWHRPNAQILPIAPVMSLTQIKIVARDGSETEVPSQHYWLERDAQTPRVRAAQGSLPGIPLGGSVQIKFRAGLAETWETLPSDLRQAVLMLAAHFYEYRHDMVLSSGCMPFGVSSLIERYRNYRLGLVK